MRRAAQRIAGRDLLGESIPNAPMSATPAPAGDEAIRPRRPWLAGLLAFLFPGLGHLYIGRWLVALMLAVVPAVILLGALAAGALWDRGLTAVIYGAVLLGIAFRLAQAAWAVSDARRSEPQYRLGFCNRGSAYAGFIALSLIWVQGLSFISRASVLEIFKIPSGGMAPSLLAGDQVVAVKFGFDWRSIQRGDVVVFRSPADPKVTLIKRVVGLAGDEVAFIGGALQLNGKMVVRRSLGARSYPERVVGSDTWVSVVLATFQETLGQRTFLIAEQPSMPRYRQDSVRVPEGMVFLVGDNRGNSQDSRHYGAIPLENVIGQVHSVLLSLGPDGLRFERFGLRL